MQDPYAKWELDYAVMIDDPALSRDVECFVFKEFPDDDIGAIVEAGQVLGGFRYSIIAFVPAGSEKAKAFEEAFRQRFPQLRLTVPKLATAPAPQP